jgi:hypothetical protein
MPEQMHLAGRSRRGRTCAALLVLAALAAGCEPADLVEVRRGGTFKYSVPLANPANSGANINAMWVSYAMPPYIVFDATSSVVGPAPLPAGKSWNAVGEFNTSSGTPLGCQAVAYLINTSDAGLFPDPNQDPPSMVGLFVSPEKSGFWQRLASLWSETLCSYRKRFKIGPDWHWSTPGPAQQKAPAQPAGRAS